MNVTTTALPFLGGNFASLYNTKLGSVSESLNTIKVLQIAFIVFFVQRVFITVHRLYFHPLSSFPGPKLAAATSLYETWYAVLSPTSVPWPEYERTVLHPRYGPIVRVRPDALHVSDPAAFRQIHKAGRKFKKARYFYGSFKLDNSVFGDLDVDFQRERKALMAPLFAKPEIVGRYEELVRERTSFLMNRISRIVADKGGKGVVLMKTAISALVADIAADVIFKGSYGILNSKDMTHPVTESVDLFNDTVPIFIYFPLLIPLLESIPDWFMSRVFPSGSGQNRLIEAITKMVDALEQGKKTGNLKSEERQSVVAQLLDHLDAKTLVVECFSVFGAAVHTTQWSIQRTIYHLAANPSIQQKVFEELKSAYPQRDSEITSAELESLPYFVAVMKEALRLSHAVSGSLPREAPSDGHTELCGRHIPPGTILESDIYHIHLNDSLFPDAHKFEPGRWLQGDGSKALEKYLVPYSMGSYMCLGYTLANLVMYVSVAKLVRRFEIELTPELEKEGFRFATPWTAVKRGAKIEFIVRERAESE